MTAYSKEENNKVLEAWNEWKTVCSILGCSQEHSLLLAKLVGNSFRQKLARVIHNPHPVEDIRTCAHEFDMGIIEKATNPGMDKRTGLERTKKNYKDVAWQKCEESNDTPLKVIHGVLIGPQGIINDIVESYGEKEYGYDWLNKAGKRFLVHHQSINAPVEGNNGSTTEWGDFINDLCTPPQSLDDSEMELINQEAQKYTPQEAAILLASLADLAMTEPTLLAFIDRRKTWASEKIIEIRTRLGLFLEACFSKESFLQIQVLTQIKKLFFMKLAAEKGASEFLSMLKDKMSKNK